MRFQPAKSIALALATALALGGCSLTDARNAARADAEVTPLNMAKSLRPGLVALPDYPSTGWEPGKVSPQASPSPTPSDTPSAPDASDPLAQVGIRNADLLAGSRVAVVPDGTSLGTPTLDFCEAKYPSESLRVKRLQTGAYTKAGAYMGLSTEVVVYDSVKSAKQALAEVIAARLACTEGKKFKTYDGHTIEFAFHKALGPTNTPLVGADSRLIIHTTMIVDGKPQRAFLVYQIDGPVLAALYVSDPGSKPFAQVTLDNLFGLAGRIATRLTTYVRTLGNVSSGNTTSA